MYCTSITLFKEYYSTFQFHNIRLSDEPNYEYEIGIPNCLLDLFNSTYNETYAISTYTDTIYSSIIGLYQH